MIYERFGFGKHKGQLVADVPSSYLAWCLRELHDLDRYLRRAIEQELERRDAKEAQRQQDADEAALAPYVVRRWYHTMARQYHPDRGGSHEEMLVVNKGRDLMMELLQTGAT